MENKNVKILDFWAPWCGACKMMDPVLEAFSKKHNIPIEKVNTDENVFLMEKYHIQGIPTILVIDENDQEVDRLIGYMPLIRLEKKLGLA